MFDLAGDKNRASADPPDRMGAPEIEERRSEPALIEEREHRSAFATGEDESINHREVVRATNFARFSSEPLKHLDVRVDTTLES
jgi:hypothetical protein